MLQHPVKSTSWGCEHVQEAEDHLLGLLLPTDDFVLDLLHLVLHFIPHLLHLILQGILLPAQVGEVEVLAGVATGQVAPGKEKSVNFVGSK